MTAPTNEELHRRISSVEEDVSELKSAVVRLETTLPSLKTDIEDIRKGQERSDAARDLQTQVLAGKIDKVRDRAMDSVPTWASSTISVLAVLLAAFITVYFTK